MKTKKQEFIELEYTGKIKDQVFDTNLEQIAKDNKIHNPKFKYKPQVICIGQKQVVQGLDNFLEDKELNKQYKITLQPEEAFGKKNPKLLRLIPTSKFKSNKINPFPGLKVNIDGSMGVIKTSGGGRSIVDFNHPLSGQEITYAIKILKIVKDTKIQLDSLIELYLTPDFKSKIEDNIATITFPNKIPEIITTELAKKIKELIPSIKKVNVEYTKQKDTIQE